LDHVDKVSYGTVPGSFGFFGEITARQFRPAPVIIKTLTAYPRFSAAKGTGTMGFIDVNVTGLCSHYASVYRSFRQASIARFLFLNKAPLSLIFQKTVGSSILFQIHRV
jgi:hypothetical protein